MPKFKSMLKIVARIIMTLWCLGIVLFSVFGFMATFEPLPLSTQMTWRVVYSAVGLLSILGVIGLNYPWKH
jgi:hypothetical protein